MKNAELGNENAKHFACVIEDRWLLNSGKPQKYVSQWDTIFGRFAIKQPVDEQFTDDERNAAGFPKLAEVQALIANHDNITEFHTKYRDLVLKVREHVSKRIEK